MVESAQWAGKGNAMISSESFSQGSSSIVLLLELVLKQLCKEVMVAIPAALIVKRQGEEVLVG